MAVQVLVGTTKGVFLLEAEADRQAFAVRGPFCDGWPINHVIGDPDSGALWAAGGGEWHGGGIWASEDGGASWTLTKLSNGKWDDWIADNPEEAAQFGMTPPPPAPFTGRISAIWSLARANGHLYAGALPAALLRSADAGAIWEPVEALNTHESRDTWQPGAAGMNLHTIVTDPGNADRLWVAISAAGVFATEDGGASWERRNRRSNAGRAEHERPEVAMGGDPAEIGHCVHNMVRAPGSADVLYQQNHHGIYRSPDGGRSWTEVSGGLPSTFGFPIAVHPRAPETIFVLPLNGDDAGRYPPEASAAVWRSRDGGESWTACRAGLPQQNCFFTVLRQAMATDSAETPGLYFGTNSGSVFASFDEGDSFEEIARHLPTVLCVEALTRA